MTCQLKYICCVTITVTMKIVIVIVHYQVYLQFDQLLYNYIKHNN